jgi:hypothetical protein
VRWKKSRTKAWRLQDGKKGGEIGLADAAKIAAGLGLKVPACKSGKMKVNKHGKAGNWR